MTELNRSFDIFKRIELNIMLTRFAGAPLQTKPVVSLGRALSNFLVTLKKV